MNHWTPANYPPDESGHYLVAQENEDHRKYRFVRYWNGSVWNNPNDHQYGQIIGWMELPEWPKF